MKKKRNTWLFTAAVLMMFMAAVRAVGGVILLLKGKNVQVDRAIIASQSEIVFVGIGLILISALFVISAVGILGRRSLFWKLGILVAALFVLDGAANGFLLFGQPLEAGTVMNTVAAGLIIGFLLLGKGDILAESPPGV